MVDARPKKKTSDLGTGGSAKDGVIVIQGNHRDNVKEALAKEGC